jgi:hypothetical protein
MDDLKYVKYKKRQNYNYIVNKSIKQTMEESGEIQSAKRRKSSKQDNSRENNHVDSSYDDEFNGNNIKSQKSSCYQYPVCIFIFFLYLQY